MTILVFAEVFGIIDWMHLFSDEPEKSSFFVPAILLSGYFTGIVLEELVYWIGRIPSFFKKKKVSQKNDDDEQIEKMKESIIGAGHEGLIESPLTHMVMSKAYVLAFFSFFAINTIRVLTHAEFASTSGWIGRYIIAPILLAVVFFLRQFHYKTRRLELIERYDNAYCSKEDEKNGGQTEEERK